MKKVIVMLLACCLMLSLLCSCGLGKKEPVKYMVLVMDQENAPVPGVLVEFCTDTQCVTATSDETGIAELDAESATYTVHILKVPEGFAPYEQELSIGPQADLLTVNLSPAA